VVHIALGRTLSVTTAGEHRLICELFLSTIWCFMIWRKWLLWDIWGQRLPYRKDGAIDIGASFFLCFSRMTSSLCKSLVRSVSFSHFAHSVLFQHSTNFLYPLTDWFGLDVVGFRG